jgi:hypothetical protein
MELPYVTGIYTSSSSTTSSEEVIFEKGRCINKIDNRKTLITTNLIVEIVK